MANHLARPLGSFDLPQFGRPRRAHHAAMTKLGVYVQSGAEVLQCTEHGVWVRKGEKRPA
jgi:NADH dehydrogenase FAD-containing subunit